MHTIHIGLVEDNVRLGQDIREKLALSDGVAVLWEKRNGEDALKILADGQIPDVVLMDIAMPGMDGIATTRQAKQSHPDLKILMLTVMDDEQRLFEALKAGASGYLLKDIKPHQLLNAIDEVLDGGLPLSLSLASKVLRPLFFLSLQKIKPLSAAHQQGFILKTFMVSSAWMQQHCPQTRIPHPPEGRSVVQDTGDNWFLLQVFPLKREPCFLRGSKKQSLLHG